MAADMEEFNEGQTDYKEKRKVGKLATFSEMRRPPLEELFLKHEVTPGRL